MGQTNDKSSGRPGRRHDVDRSPRFNAARFVQFELDAVQSKQCKTWELDDSSILMAMVALCDDGYGITLRWDTFSDSYACWLQIRGEDTNVNAGLILSGRGSTPAKAFKQALFKHRLMDSDWRAWAERPKPVIDD